MVHTETAAIVVIGDALIDVLAAVEAAIVARTSSTREPKLSEAAA